eukprot:1686705-Pyramimonas_sp.AAC.1
MHIVQKFGGVQVHGPYLYQAGESLVQLMAVIRGNRVVMPDAERDQLIWHFDMHMRCCTACSITLTPKHHLTVHMICRWALVSGGIFPALEDERRRLSKGEEVEGEREETAMGEDVEERC